MQETWRERLIKGLDGRKLSKRAASLTAGMAEGYVHGILSEGKEPSVENLIKVCEANGLAATYVIFGYEVTPEIEELGRLYAAASPELQDGIRSILKARKAS